MGEYYKFNHNDMASLEKNLERATKMAAQKGGGILVITEGVFGMSGKVGDLKAIVELKKKFDFRLLVDDAHGFGTMGETGGGVAEMLEVTKDVDLYFSTFAKSMAAIGGFIASDDETIIMYLKYNMRSQIYAKALPMPYVEGGRKRLELIKKHPELRKNLWTIVNALQDGLRERGFNIGETTSPVTPVFVQGIEGGLPEVTMVVRDLRDNMGIFCSIVTYPVVPKGQVILRIIPTAAHSLEDVERTLNAFSAIRERIETGFYRKNLVVPQYA